MQRNTTTPAIESDVSKDTLAALRSGEERAYNEVYTRYAGPLRDFLAALLRSDADAEELNHDIFLDLWLHRERIDPEKGVRGLLYVQAKHLAMNWFARKKVRAKYEEFCSWVDAHQTLPADEEVIARETQILIEIALRGMSERKQAIWRMNRHEGRSPSEIAAELGVSVSTVTHSLTEIKRHLGRIVALFTLVFLS